jgi:protein-tyrosine phosphatase
VKDSVQRLFLISVCFFIALTTTSARPAADNSGKRQVELDGQHNFRDLGGYETTDGRFVKWETLYRSGELHALSDEDVEILDALGIDIVVSFLTANEIATRGEDRVPERVIEVSLPLDGDLGVDGMIDELLHARQTGDFARVPPDINPEIHRSLMTEGSGQYADFLLLAAESDDSTLLFHCSHGVHRTGTAAALLLSALGVPWDTVREDYLLSNDYRSDEITPRLEQLKMQYAEYKGISVDDVDTTNMDAFYILEGTYIDASLDYAVAEYGSMDNYIRKGLGIGDDVIEKLKELYLEN